MLQKILDNDFATIHKTKVTLRFVIKSKCDDDSNKLVVGKDETVGVATAEFFGIKPKMYSILVDDSSEHKKAKDVNKNVVATISHNEYKDVLLNNKCFRHSINRIQTKNQ